MVFFLILTIIVIASLSISALRNKVLRDIGFRNVLRRKSTTFLIIFGSLIGTALIAGSLTLGDSFAKSSRVRAENTLGEIDAIAQVTNPNISEIGRSNNIIENSNEGFFTKETFNKINSFFDSDKVDGVLPADLFSVSIVKGDGDPSKNLSLTNANLISFPNQQFSQENINFNIEDGKTIISQEVADRLEIKAGDQIKIFNDLKNIELTVQSINTQKGATSYTSGNGNILVSQDFLITNFGIKADTYNRIFISSKGSAFETSYNGDQFTSYLDNKFNMFNDSNTQWGVKELKAAQTTGGGTLISSAFLVVSLLGVAAGVLLIINIYSMLAEERKSEMGTLRALALTRGKLIKTFLYEGLIYSVLSSFIGVFIGIGIGWILLSAVTLVAKGVNPDINIVFDSTLNTWIASFCIGLLITFGTAFIASFRISRISIVSAIRNLPDEKDIRVTVWGIIKILIYVMLLLQSIGTIIIGIVFLTAPKENFASLDNIIPLEALGGYCIFIGIFTVCLFLSILISKLLSFTGKDKYKRFVYTIFNLPPLLIALFIDKIGFFSKVFTTSLGPTLLLFTGLTIVVTATIIITFNLDLILWLFEKTLGRIPKFAGVLRLALRYAAENKLRMGLTILMFSLILFLVGFLSVLRLTIDSQLEKFAPTSGYDAYVTAGRNIDPAKIKADVEKAGVTSEIAINKSLNVNLDNVTAIELFGSYTNGFVKDINQKVPAVTFEFDKKFIDTNPLKLSERLPMFATDQDAFNAALNDGKYVFLTPQLFGVDGKPIEKMSLGKTINLRTNDKISQVVVAGILDQTSPQNYTIFQYGLIGSDKLYADYLDQKYVTDNYVNDISFKLAANGKSRAENLKVIQKQLIPYNISDRLFSIAAIFQQIGDVFRSSIIILQGFLSFGLFVGIAGIAILMTRSVNERKQQIGMLRSLGFQRSSILISFFIESSFIIFLGVVLGLISGALSANIFINALNNSQAGSQKTSVVIPYNTTLFKPFGVSQ